MLVFDLGNVVVDFDQSLFLRQLAAYFNCSLKEVERHIFNSGLENRYDRGSITSQEFFQQATAMLGTAGSYQRFTDAWNTIFTARPEMDALLAALKKRYRLGLLSNTNELHFSSIQRAFPVIGVFDDLFLSYQMGATKPDPAVFKAVIDRTGVDPSHILFIDDIPAHIDAAKSCGMQGIVYTHISHLRLALTERGVSLS